MKQQHDQHAAIVDLHERGYYADFELIGNDLLWIQEKIFLRPEEYAIAAYYAFPDNAAIIFGITVTSHNVKGILMNHYRNYTTEEPAIIKEKLVDFFSLQLIGMR